MKKGFANMSEIGLQNTSPAVHEIAVRVSVVVLSLQRQYCREQKI